VKSLLGRCAVFGLALLLPLTNSLAYSVEAASLTIELARRPVALTLVKAEDLSPANWPSGNVKVLVESAQLEANANIYELLQANGIAPDTEAFTVVYDLNPTLRDLKTLGPQTSLQLPKVVGGSELQAMLHGGYLVMLTVDPKLREELNRRIEVLQQAVGQFTLLPAERFPSTAESESAKNSVKSLGKWYAQIEKSFLRRTGPPLRRESLVQLSSEADRLKSLLEEAVQSNRKLGTADLGQITAIHDDVELEITKYGQVLANEAPKADALYKVVVSITGGDAELIHGLRVYYKNYGLYHEPPGEESDPFRNPGSGASELLRVQNYMIWAARDGDPAHPLTKLLVKVRPWDPEPISVTLSLAQRNPR
jgi:hypothetical protein